MNLHDWTEVFLKQRDVHRRLMTSLNITASGFEQKNKDGTVTHVKVSEQLDIDAQYDIIVCLNTEENVHVLVQHWKEFVRNNPLIVFAHPSSNDKWLLKPAMHARVADDESLEQGLLSMAGAISFH